MSIRVFIALVATAVGCSTQKFPSAPEPQQGQVLRVREQVRAAPNREMGEDCSANGGSVCKGAGLCLHYSDSVGSGYACTQACSKVAECPKEWSCERISLEPNSDFCVPPSNWEPKKATAQAGNLP